MNDAAALYALSHVTALKELLEQLVPLNIELQEHSFDSLCFGSWVMVAGRSRQRYRFVWDGKESLLSVSSSTFSDSQSAAQWREMPEHSSLVTSTEALGKVRAVLVEAYARQER